MVMKAAEIWKPISGYEGLYEVSNKGAVRSLDRVIRSKKGHRKYKGCLFSPSDNGVGYFGLTLSNGGKLQRILVHRVVCEAFHGKPDGRVDACHLNGDRKDNRAENLCWGTRAENEAHKWIHGTRPCKLNASAVRTIRKEAAEGVPQFILAERFGVSRANLSCVVLERSWRHVR